MRYLPEMGHVASSIFAFAGVGMIFLFFLSFLVQMVMLRGQQF